MRHKSEDQTEQDPNDTEELSDYGLGPEGWLSPGELTEDGTPFDPDTE